MMIGTWIASHGVPESTGAIGPDERVDRQPVEQQHDQRRHRRGVVDEHAVAHEHRDDAEEPDAPAEEQHGLVHVRGRDAPGDLPARRDAPRHHREPEHGAERRDPAQLPAVALQRHAGRDRGGQQQPPRPRAASRTRCSGSRARSPRGSGRRAARAGGPAPRGRSSVWSAFGNGGAPPQRDALGARHGVDRVAVEEVVDQVSMRSSNLSSDLSPGSGLVVVVAAGRAPGRIAIDEPAGSRAAARSSRTACRPAARRGARCGRRSSRSAGSSSRAGRVAQPMTIATGSMPCQRALAGHGEHGLARLRVERHLAPVALHRQPAQRRAARPRAAAARHVPRAAAPAERQHAGHERQRDDRSPRPARPPAARACARPRGTARCA